MVLDRYFVLESIRVREREIIEGRKLNRQRDMENEILRKRNMQRKKDFDIKKVFVVESG